MSLRARVALASVAATAVVLFLAGAALFTLVQRDERASLDRRLASEALAISRPGALAESFGERRVRRNGPFDVGVVARLLLEGQAIAATDGFPTIPPHAEGGYATVNTEDGAWRVLSREVQAPPSVRQPVFVQVAAPTSSLDATLDALRTSIIVVGLVALGTVGVASWSLASMATRPLRRIRDEAERVSVTQDLRVRVPTDQGPAEVDELGASINRMLERIGEATDRREAALEAARAFAANAAHELRTPLTSMQTNLDVLARNPDIAREGRDEILRDLATEQRRLLASLEALRLLARGDLQRTDVFEPLDLADALYAAVQRCRDAFPDATIGLTIAEGSFAATAWPEGIASLFDNLLRNAATHGRAADVPPMVDVTLGRAGDGALVRIADHGPGIPEAERARLLERFARGDNARGEGSGLGLALVEQQVALHHGTIELSETPGGGLTVTVFVPVLPAG